MLLDQTSSPTPAAAADQPASPSPDQEQPAPPPVWAAEIPVTPGQDVWVFGYGSLMWNPGFPVAEQRQACLRGYHRRFCVASHRYRGTPAKPGLVLGLDRGGSCHGIAFRVAAQHVAETMAYLWDREMITRAYRPKFINLCLAAAENGGQPTGPERVSACTFVVDRRHEQYRGCLDEQETAQLIANSAGTRGPNRDYLFNTVDHLRQLGIKDARLESLRQRVETLGNPVSG